MHQDLLMSIYVFILAIFVGFEVISKVPPTLHTPLMSGSNAISGITLLGSLVVAALAREGGVYIIAFLAVFLASINVLGGYAVTDRMLKMFKKKE